MPWKESMKEDTDWVPWLNYHLEYLFRTTLYNIHPTEAISHFKITWECVLVTCGCVRLQSVWAIPKGAGKHILIWCTPGLKLHFYGFDFWAKICILMALHSLSTAVSTSSSSSLEYVLHISFKTLIFSLMLSLPYDSPPYQCYCPVTPA